MRIGIFGGTFDPPHSGHINVALNALRSGIVDQVWLVVSPQNPFKADKKRTPADLRLFLCQLLIDSLGLADCLKVSDVELTLPIPSYMINTLDYLSAQYPEDDFRLIIGEDNLADFHRWKDSDRLIREYALIVYPRDNNLDGTDFVSDKIPANCVILKSLPKDATSSTAIRSLARHTPPDMEKIAALTSAPLAEYIVKHRLYTD